MPRYFMHLIGGRHKVPDLEGKEHRSLMEATTYAIDAARDIVADKVRHGEVLDGEAIEIVDARGFLVDLVRLRDVYDIPGPDVRPVAPSSPKNLPGQ